MKRNKITRIIIVALITLMTLCPIAASAEESESLTNAENAAAQPTDSESLPLEEKVAAQLTDEVPITEIAFPKIGVVKRPEGVRKQHSALFSPEGARAAARGGPLAVDEDDQKTPLEEKVAAQLTDEVPITENPFEEIYEMAADNADKIFSVLAFLGTLVVGIGYKSGLYPLLRDALSRLKSSIEQAKEENDKNALGVTDKMTALTEKIEDIGRELKEQSEELSRINWQFESYEALLKERAALKTILEGQIDMLYSIFMSTSLPQYQKDEIGERIAQLKQELKAYEATKN